MKPNPSDEARRWFLQAEDELADANLLSREKRYYLALYLCQQSAEKALKAFLYQKGQIPTFTHSVAVLLEMSLHLDSSFSRLSAAKRLDDYYIPTRYPNGLPGGIPSRYFNDPIEAEAALKLSKKVLDLVRSKLHINE